ncbi:MAG: hypothetical protein HON90_09800 [Halobacteriovoraceae bacterium]|jgi:hypothetical protein|nr:hypothetical protein [Halobacteriovoraceae bacterium]
MIEALALHSAQFALTIGKDQAVKYLKGKVDLKVLETVQAKVEQEINQFVLSIQKRTIAYVSLSVLNLSSAAAAHSWSTMASLNYIALIISIGFLAFIISNTVKTFTATVGYLENFENHIKLLLTEEFKKAKEKNWKNKLTLLVNSKDAQDYYHFVLEQIVESFSAWLRKNKSLLYSRLAFYFIASFCLTLSMRGLL